MNEQNERIMDLIASGIAPLDALKMVKATDAIAKARKAVTDREIARQARLDAEYERSERVEFFMKVHELQSRNN